MAKKPIGIDELSDMEAVDVSADVMIMEEARIKAEKAAAAAAAAEDDEDDDEEEDEDDSSDDPSAEDDAAEEDEAEEEDDTPVKGSVTDVPKVPKKKKLTVDERFAEITAARRAAEKEAFEAELRAQAAEERAAALEAKTAEATAELVAPKPSDFIYGDVDPEYQEALVDYRVAKKLAESQSTTAESKKAQTEAQRNAAYASKLDTVMAEGSKKHENFKEVIGSTTFDAHLARLILDSDNPVDIAWHLSNNVGELLKATKADAETRARLIGKLEGSLSVSSTVRKRSKAPEPLGKGKKSAPKGDEAIYGPSDQDAFDEAFNS